MRATTVKIRSKEVLIGYYAKSDILFSAMVSAALVWGILTQLLRDVMNLQIISGGMYSAWEKLPHAVGILCALLALLLSAWGLAPLHMGVNAWFVGGAMGKKRTGRWLVYWLRPKRAASATAFYLSLLFRKLLTYCLFLLPGLAMLAGCGYLLFVGIEQSLLLALLACAAVLLLLGMGFGFVAAQKYFAAKYLVARKPGICTKQAVEESKALLQGRLLHVAVFKASFLPWFLLCVLLVPAFYVWPYYRQACAVWVQNARTQHNKAQAEQQARRDLLAQMQQQTREVALS